MKLQQFIVRFAIFLGVITFCDMYPKTQKDDQLYQDVIIDNKVVQKTNNHMDCDARYKIIKQLLDQYRRPFTMLDIGASQGYYSLRTAYDYKDAVCVMIESNNPSYPHVADKLLSICRANDKLDNIILLDKYLTPDWLQRLSECEHFDVILALNIIHFFKDKWQAAADAILNMGDYVVIEIPPCGPEIKEYKNQLRSSIIEYIIARGGKVFGTAHRHNPAVNSNIYLVETKKKKLERKTWLLPKTTNDYIIESTFTEKKLTKPVSYPPKMVQTTDWLAGINLLTFKMCNGIYPSIDAIENGLNIFYSRAH